jgi:hypothetical protein
MASLSRIARGAVVVVLFTLGLSCANDANDEPEATTETDAANVLSITARDYSFEVDGDAGAGALTIDVANEGKEWHEIVMAKLQEDKTLDDVREALENAGEDEDPFEAFEEESGTQIDDLGGSQFPQTSYEITGGGVEAGDYALICFVPNEEGKSHWSLGMLGEFTIGEGAGDADTGPAPDITYTIGDEGLEGPSEVDAGETSIRIVNDSSGTKELGLLRIKDGKTPKDVADSLAGADEGPPPPATAPFDFFAYVFDAEQDRTISVDLTPGRWALQSGDPEEQTDEPLDEDPFTVMFTVR